jgi:hypothetical protein
MKRVVLYVFMAWFTCGWVGGTAHAAGDMGIPILVQGVTGRTAENVSSRGGPGPISMAFNNATAIQRDQKGTLHLLWVENGHLLYGRKTPGAELTHQLLESGVQRHPALGLDGSGGVVVVWPTRTGLFAVVSEDSGETFGGAIQLSHQRVGSPTVRVWSEGVGSSRRVSGVVGWHIGNKTKDTTVYAANLVDGHFQEPVRLESDGAASEFVTTSGYKGASIMVWRDNRGGGRGWELYMSQQPSPSVAWSAPVRIGEGMDPSVCVTAKGEVHLTYQARMQVFYRRSEDNGATWLDAVRLGDGLFSKLSCNDSGGVAMAWEDMRARTKEEIGSLYRNDKVKTVGLATSTDHGRHIVSDTPFDRKSLTLAHVAVDSGMMLDLVFLDTEDMTLRVHRAGL